MKSHCSALNQLQLTAIHWRAFFGVFGTWDYYCCLGANCRDLPRQEIPRLCYLFANATQFIREIAFREAEPGTLNSTINIQMHREEKSRVLLLYRWFGARVESNGKNATGGLQVEQRAHGG